MRFIVIEGLQITKGRLPFDRKINFPETVTANRRSFDVFCRQCPFLVSTMAGGLSSFIEGQADALFNTIWWHSDSKFGLTNRIKHSAPGSTVGRLWREARLVWYNVLLRASLLLMLPYVLAVFCALDRPGRLGMQLACASVTVPWIYHICIYTWFLDPLRHLPGPKVSCLINANAGPLAIRSGIWSRQRRCTCPGMNDAHSARLLPTRLCKDIISGNIRWALHIPCPWLSTGNSIQSKCRIVLHQLAKLCPHRDHTTSIQENHRGGTTVCRGRGT
jgi:hypothetical protein